jgi:hypothetical protein
LKKKHAADSGEKALSSYNRAQIERVVLALNDALVARG